MNKAGSSLPRAGRNPPPFRLSTKRSQSTHTILSSPETARGQGATSTTPHRSTSRVDEIQLAAIAYWVPMFHPEMVAKAMLQKERKEM
jgi:hypothetical protein